MRSKAAELFQEQTGRDLKAVKPGDRSAPGKFWLQKPLETVEEVLEVHWEYYVDDGVDGKSDGWHPYEEEASEEVEALYQQFLADGCTGRTSKRVVNSGYFSYELQFKAMSQKNTSTRKVRSIRRKQGPRPEPAKKGTVRKVKAMKKTSKVMKTTVKAPKKAPMKAPMKAMKKVSSIAVGKRARSSVWNGKKLKTKTGLKKEPFKLS